MSESEDDENCFTTVYNSQTQKEIALLFLIRLCDLCPVIFVQKEKEEEKCREFAKNHAAMSMEQNMAYLSSAKHANNYSCYFLFF
jgi:hypothetical protein